MLRDQFLKALKDFVDVADRRMHNLEPLVLSLVSRSKIGKATDTDIRNVLIRFNDFFNEIFQQLPKNSSDFIIKHDLFPQQLSPEFAISLVGQSPMLAMNVIKNYFEKIKLNIELIQKFVRATDRERPDRIDNDEFEKETSIVIFGILTTEKLISAIEGFENVYSVYSTLTSSSESNLRVASLDSGTEFKITFSGIGEVIEKTQNFIISLWDRASSGKRQNVLRNLEVYKQINEACKAGSINQDQAQHLLATLRQGASRIIEARALSQEIADSLGQGQHALLSPPTDLLIDDSMSSDS